MYEERGARGTKVNPETDTNLNARGWATSRRHTLGTGRHNPSPAVSSARLGSRAGSAGPVPIAVPRSSRRRSRAVPAPSRGDRAGSARHRLQRHQRDWKFIACYPGWPATGWESFQKLPRVQVLQDLSVLPCEQRLDEHSSGLFSAPTSVGCILRSSALPLCPLFQVFCLLKALNVLKAPFTKQAEIKFKKGFFLIW